MSNLSYPTANSTPITMDMLANSISMLQANVDDFFLIICGALVYAMQPGFAFLETGSMRSKNATNSLFRNFVGGCISAMVYFLFGYAFAFGEPKNAFFGYGNFALADLPPSKYSFWWFEFVFAAACNSIVSGAIAERSDVLSYFAYNLAVPGFIYSVVTHWTWDPSGWLQVMSLGTYQDGFRDFAGSGGVHVCGATVALVGCIVLGPRIGAFRKSSQDKTELQAHSVPLVALGCFLLMFGFLGFNGGSLLHISKVGDGPIVAETVVNTILSGGWAGFTTVLLVRVLRGHWSILQPINGALAGMVAICSGCDAMYPWAASVTGMGAGLTYVVLQTVIPKLGLDDSLDTVALHGGGGTWGLFATAIFDRKRGIVYLWSKDAFLLLAVQTIGLLAIVGWSVITSAILFTIMRLIRVYRVTEQVELLGLDVETHKEPAYRYLDRDASIAPLSPDHCESQNGIGRRSHSASVSTLQLPTGPYQFAPTLRR